MIELKGMTWDHIRGYGPLVATAQSYQSIQPDVSIKWDRRSLKDFGDYPINKLAEKYDIILIDHPHVGVSCSENLLLPLGKYLDSEFLQEQQQNSVGNSFQSYFWKGEQWALAVDAAAQVSAYRPDMIDKSDTPVLWDEFKALTESATYKKKLGWPLSPTDAMCSFITLCNQIGGEAFFDISQGMDISVGVEALEQMEQIIPWLHPISLNSNPIHILDYMSKENDLAYVPLTFGYSNYSRNGFSENLVHFTNIPSFDGQPYGSILGGVGIAVSSFSKYVEESVSYAAYVADPKIQKTTYVQSGGQPGHRLAWLDPDVNRECGGFFANSIQTLDLAKIRPRHAAFPEFQEKAAVLLHQELLENIDGAGTSAKKVMNRLNDLYFIIMDSETGRGVKNEI